MSTADTKASQQSQSQSSTLPQLSGGLFLTGTVIATRTEEKEWEKEKYTQTTISISDGEQVFLFRHRHTSEPFAFPVMFQPVKIRVKRAATEKGQITVGGDFVK